MKYKFKRTLSFFLALCVIFTANITSLAADKPNAKKIKNQIDGAALYLTSGVERYGVNEAVDFCIIADSGADVSVFSDAFLSDVKANLNTNGGKIVSSYGENLVTYAAVIISLVRLGENPADFNGYDITKAFTAMNPSADMLTPNYYRIVIQAALYCEDSDKFSQTLCDKYIGSYYTMGRGVDYFGFSCDNTAYFIDAICVNKNNAEKYINVLNDAIKVLESYKVDGGYCFNPVYDTKPNTNSTALALMAQSAYVSNFDNPEKGLNVLNIIYERLCTFESSEAGVFTYDKAESPYATKDALIALSRYYSAVSKQSVLSQSSVLTVIVVFSATAVFTLSGILLLYKKRKNNKAI